MWEQANETETGGTGDTQVDEALRPLAQLDELGVHEHAAVVEEVHRSLQDRLTTEEQPEPIDGEG